MRWNTLPAAEEPATRTLLLVALVILGAAAAGLAMESAGWGILAGGLLLTAVRAYFLPTAVRLEDSGPVLCCGGLTRRRSWSEFARAETDGAGVFLLPRARPGVRHPRGLHLRCPGRQEDVLTFVRPFLRHD